MIERVLIVDDEASKRQIIYQLLGEKFEGADVTEARSFTSAIAALKSGRFDLMILDMRIPTFDVAVDESGGRPRNFGGEEILQKMQRKKIVVPTLVLTQYSMFHDDASGDVLALDDLRRRLTGYPSFRGLIQFRHSDRSWRHQFTDLLTKVGKE